MPIREQAEGDVREADVIFQGTLREQWVTNPSEPLWWSEINQAFFYDPALVKRVYVFEADGWYKGGTRREVRMVRPLRGNVCGDPRRLINGQAYLIFARRDRSGDLTWEGMLNESNRPYLDTVRALLNRPAPVDPAWRPWLPAATVLAALFGMVL